MQKKKLLIGLGIFLISFVSAYGYFGGGFFNIDMSIIVLALLFLIFFAFTNFIFKRVFRDRYGEPNRATAGVIAFAVSALIILGINKIISNIMDWIYNIGISNSTLYLILIIFLILIGIVLIKRIKLCGFLIVLGAISILSGIGKLVYQVWFVIIFGIIILLLGIWGCMKKPKKKKEKDEFGPPSQTNIPPDENNPRKRERDCFELQKNYEYYYTKLANADSNDRFKHRYTQAIRAIEKMARRQGCRLRKPKASKIKKGPESNPPRTRGPTGVARFDLIVGTKNYADPHGKISATDLTNTNSTEFYIRNGGTGGVLSWKAAASKGLRISPSSGKLTVGRSQRVIVEVINRNIRFTPHITIYAKRGADRGARNVVGKAVGKAVLPFKVRVKGRSNIVDRFGNSY